MVRLVGIHYLLAVAPIWATALVLWLATDGVIHLMRDKFEGLGYQVSYSAKFGDALLIIAVLIAATILQRGGVYLPEWLRPWGMQAAVLGICVAIGLVVSFVTLDERSGQAADVYHDIVIGPTILFFAITLAPVVWYNGTPAEKFWVLCFALLWAALVVFDIKSERMNQRQWLVKHGFAIKGEISRR